MSKLPPRQFGQTLYSWYEQHGRDLPWRRTSDPYKIWVSEIMLQQTQVDRVINFYGNFLERFPDVHAVALASWEEVLDRWRGLGYYRRARNLHAAARRVAHEFNGRFPADYDELKKLPGIGSYTAAAIACFAFGQDIPAIDTNVEKVFGHVFGNGWSVLKPTQKFAFVRKYIERGDGARFHHAVMDAGTALSAGEPCPFHASCGGLEVKRQRVKRPSLAPPRVHVAVGVLIHDGQVLIAKRKAGDSWGGYWEFPGGKVEKDEDERVCLKREMQEELGIEVSVRPFFYRCLAEHNGRSYLLSFHRCSLLMGMPVAREAEAIQWIKPENFNAYTFPPANAKVIELLKNKKGMWRA